jgi:CrcB protein
MPTMDEVHLPSVPPSAETGAEGRDTAERRDTAQRRRSAQVLGAIAVGGMIGASARYGVGVALPTPHGGLPAATLLVNTSGCLLIGVLMVLIGDMWSAHPLIRPFLGVGILGGYTTFSSATVEVQSLVAAGLPLLGLGYLAGTAVAALLAVQLGVIVTRMVALPRSTARRGHR